MRLRRSDMTSIERARSRTLRMTIKIVVVFIFCWTPYITMSLWYVIDKQSAKEVDELLQESLFIMAVGNSCANPLVYGSYAIDLKKECCRCFLPCTTASRRSNVDVHLIQRSIVGSGQTKSTNVVGLNKALAVVQAPTAATTTLPGRRPASPKPSVSSINDNGLAVAVARQTEKVQLCTMEEIDFTRAFLRKMRVPPRTAQVQSHRRIRRRNFDESTLSNKKKRGKYYFSIRDKEFFLYVTTLTR
uniref:G-protein coupled receptors family 1 profile domain-containing protein n=1 Tax=Trichogramma kaykai TaxID=54128 RepID=A0ABD2XC43_9HYME